MTNLNGEERLFLSPPHLSGRERKLVEAAFDSNYIAPLGPMVDAFEREFAEYVGISHCLALSSGTAAMHLALSCLRRQAGVDVNCEGGDNLPKVFASTLTFIGSVTPVVFEGLEPVFIDSDKKSWNMDPDLLEQALSEHVARGDLPLAVVPTDIYGQCCNLPAIRRVCDQYDVPVICDSAEAMGARYWRSEEAGDVDDDSEHRCRHAGYDAKAAVYSFNGNKIITSSGGGMLASHDEDLIGYARMLSTQAREPAPHYEHEEIGFNYRMSNIVAAIGRGQLQVLDERVDQAREVFSLYREMLGDMEGITFMPEASYNRCNRWLTVVLVDPDRFGATRDDIRLALEEENIEARPTWKPMHRQPVFQGCTVYGGEVSEELFERGLCLPSGTDMTREDVERVAGVVEWLAG